MRARFVRICAAMSLCHGALDCLSSRMRSSELTHAQAVMFYQSLHRGEVWWDFGGW